MPDLVLDYTVLNALGTQLDAIKQKFDEADVYGGAGVWTGIDESVGSAALDGALTELEGKWGPQVEEGKKQMEALAQLCRQLAQAWFEADAAAAAQIGTQNANYLKLEYEQRKAAAEHAQWLKDHPYTWTFTDHTGKTYTNTIDLWDPNTPVPEVGPPPGDYTETTSEGATINTHINEDGSSTTTVTRPDGMTYTETTKTTQDEGTGVTTTESTVQHPDGTTTKTTATVNPDGSGTMTVEGGPDGTKTFEKKPGSDKWDETTPPPPSQDINYAA